MRKTSSTASTTSSTTADSLHLNLGFTPFLVPDAQFVRLPGRHAHGTAVCGQQWRARTPNGLAVSGPRRPTLADSDLQHRALVDASDRIEHRIHTRRIRAPRRNTTTIRAAIPLPISGRPSLQRETVSQLRYLTNAGARASVSYVKGINNIKAGITYEQTFLTENDRLGIVDPTLNAPCIRSTPLRNSRTISPDGVHPRPVRGRGFAPNDTTNLNAPGNPANPNSNRA